MTRTQVQLPEALHNELRRIADEQEWSLAEVIRRASEKFVERFPQGRMKASEWKFPEGRSLGKMKVPAEKLREVLYDSLLDPSLKR